MSNDRKGRASSSRLDQSVPVLPAEGCPAWCAGQHQADDRDAVFHACIVAERDGASVALSCIEYHDPAQTGSTVIILSVDAESEPIELAENDAIRMVGTLHAESGDTSWLTVALRSALDMLDPGVGWAVPLSRTGAGLGSSRASAKSPDP
ncbi:MAG: hypothetical protein ABR922_21775 [Streptosporangiaceae bacterium]|jgi:hypothetical protein